MFFPVLLIYLNFLLVLQIAVVAAQGGSGKSLEVFFLTCLV